MQGPLRGMPPELDEYWTESQVALRPGVIPASDRWISEYGQQRMGDPNAWADSFEQQHGPKGWASEFEKVRFLFFGKLNYNYPDFVYPHCFKYN